MKIYVGNIKKYEESMKTKPVENMKKYVENMKTI